MAFFLRTPRVEPDIKFNSKGKTSLKCFFYLKGDNLFVRDWEIGICIRLS